MVQMTMQVPNDLAKRLQPITPWLPTLLELSLLKIKTKAIEVVTELVEFFSKNPSPQEVIDFHVSDHSQERLRRLLILNKEGILGEAEQLEIDELQKIEHIMVKLKAQSMEQLKAKKQ